MASVISIRLASLYGIVLLFLTYSNHIKSQFERSNAS